MTEHTIHPSSPALQSPPAPDLAALRLQGLRNLTLVIYLLYGLSLFTGLPVLLALTLNYVRLEESRGTLYHSHLRWMLRSFWWGVVWTCLGSAAAVLGMVNSTSFAANEYAQADLRLQAQFFAGGGMFMLASNWIWLLSRVVRGLVYWNEHRRMWT